MPKSAENVGESSRLTVGEVENMDGPLDLHSLLQNDADHILCQSAVQNGKGASPRGRLRPLKACTRSYYSCLATHMNSVVRCSYSPVDALLTHTGP